MKPAKTKTQIKAEHTQWIDAACNEDLSTMQAMFDDGFDINTVPPKLGMSAIQFCGRWGMNNTAQWLIDHGADISQSSQVDLRALWLAIKEHNLVLARMLVDAGADVLATNSDGDTVASVLVRSGMREDHLDLARQMIRRGVDVDQPNNDGVSLRSWIDRGIVAGDAHDAQAWRDVLGAEQARAVADEIDRHTPTAPRASARRTL